MSALSNIVEIISSLFTFIANHLLSMLQYLSILIRAVLLPPVLQGWVTPLLGTAIACVGSFGIIKMILGR